MGRGSLYVRWVCEWSLSFPLRSSARDHTSANSISANGHGPLGTWAIRSKDGVAGKRRDQYTCDTSTSMYNVDSTAMTTQRDYSLLRATGTGSGSTTASGKIPQAVPEMETCQGLQSMHAVRHLLRYDNY